MKQLNQMTSNDNQIQSKSLSISGMHRKSYVNILFNTKNLNDGMECEVSKKEKNWNAFELISIGIGGTLGFGVYILIGHISHELTGPSALVSFAIAGLVGLFAGYTYT